VEDLANVLSESLGWGEEQGKAEVSRTLAILADKHGVSL
jgi:hypothetical protein